MKETTTQMLVNDPCAHSFTCSLEKYVHALIEHTGALLGLAYLLAQAHRAREGTLF